MDKIRDYLEKGASFDEDKKARLRAFSQDYKALLVLLIVRDYLK